MMRLTTNPHNQTGPLWLIWIDQATGETIFIAEVL